MIFLHPLLLAGLALAAIAPAIYFLVKRKKRHIHWAAFEILRRALQRRKKRVEKENLWQLVLRTLAILLLALAISRPLIGPSASSEQLLILLDGTYSMQAMEDGVTRFEKAKKLASARMNQASTGSTFAVGRIDQVVELAVNRMTGSVAEATAAMEVLKPTAGSLDLAGALPRLLPVVEELKPSRVVIISDFNALGGQQELEQRLAALPPNVQVELVPVSTALATSNYCLTNLSSDSGMVLMNRPATFGVDVTYDGEAPISDFKLTLHFDDRPVDQQLLDLKPMQRTRAQFLITFRDDKPHRVTVSGPSDALGVDNTAYAYVTPRPVLRIAALEGGKELAQASERELLFFESSFANLMQQQAVQIERFSGSSFPWAKLDDYAIAVLANYGEIGPSQGEALGRFVRHGGGLIFFAGDTVRKEDINAWAQREPELLPATIEGVEASEDGWAISSKSVESPVLRFLKEDEAAGERIRFKRVAVLKPAEGASVLARLTGPGHPFGVSRGCGRGLMFFFSFTANRAWTEFPILPGYVAFSIRSVLEALGPPPKNNALPGETLVFVLSPEMADQELSLAAPQRSPVKVRAIFKDERTEVRYASTFEPGFYQLKRGATELTDITGQTVNIDGHDSELTPAAPGELAAVAKLSDRISIAGEAVESRHAGMPVSWPLVILAVFCVAGETWFSFKGRMR
jgi:hypothetical protein